MALTEKQEEANQLIATHPHSLLYGGSRSGKTWVYVRAVVVRALKAGTSSHAILRRHFNHLKHSIIYDTFPAVMEAEFPKIRYRMDKTDWFVELPGRDPNEPDKTKPSRILFGGLDDKERTEKILGQEHSTIYLNEASQIGYSARSKAITRMAQNVGLVPREFVDCNPPSKGWWGYKLFIKGIDPESGQPIPHPEYYASLAMNPGDNRENLPTDFLQTLESLPARDRKRFLEGVFAEDVEDPLWTDDMIERCRLAEAPPLRRIVVAVDPSGCQGDEDWRSDEVGIVVGGTDGKRGYLLDDASGRYSPRAWAKVAIDRLDEFGADCIVAERNFGGELVRSNIRAQSSTVRVRLVHASKGKHIRAEPVAGLYEQNKIHHVGRFPKLEEQQTQFSTYGYTGERSPDRADAWIHAVTELAIENNRKPARVIR